MRQGQGGFKRKTVLPTYEDRTYLRRGVLSTDGRIRDNPSLLRTLRHGGATRENSFTRRKA